MRKAAATFLIMLLKWVWEVKTKKKMDDDQFIKHIQAHQQQRARVATSTNDFENEIDNLSKSPKDNNEE